MQPITFRKPFARVALLATFALAGRAPAQFAGDVYFVTPSVTVPVGGVAELEIEAYLGNTPLGAAHVHVEFEVGQAEVVAFDGPTDVALQENVGQATALGRFSTVVFNGKAADRPIGTVRLGVLKLRPLVGAGQQVQVQIRVQALLDATTTAFARARGGAGVIAVTSPSAAPSGAGVVREVSFAEFAPSWQRWLLRMRPGGGEIVVQLPVAFGGVIVAVPVRVTLPPVAAGDKVK